MEPERRKTERKELHYPGWIDYAGGGRECIVWDLSERGARVTVEAPEQVPERFSLSLSRDGDSRRQCRAVWRSNEQIGVEFV